MTFELPRARRLLGLRGPSSSTATALAPGADGLDRRACIVSLFALLGSTFGASQALAHSRLVKSDPAARAVLTEAPAELKMWFNEAIEPAFAKVWIAPTNGPQTPLTTKGDDSDKRLLVVKLPTDLNGPVVIGYHVLSVDGHVVESQLAFTIQKTA